MKLEIEIYIYTSLNENNEVKPTRAAWGKWNDGEKGKLELDPPYTEERPFFLHSKDFQYLVWQRLQSNRAVKTKKKRYLLDRLEEFFFSAIIEF